MGRRAFAASTALGFGLILASTVFSRSVASQAQEHEGQYARTDVIRGQSLYSEQCSMCHGINGDAVGGTDLRRGIFRHVRSDEDVVKVLANGVPNTAMPAFKFDRDEQRALVAFVRSGLEVNGPALKIGDLSRGKVLFSGKGTCNTCHRVRGVGPRLAPDLSDIGSARRSTSIYGAMVEPAAYLMPINRTVRVEMKSGRVITGRRLNEDTYTVQIIDDQETLVSLSKADLKSYRVFTEARMPSFKNKLTEAELADLLAYLLSLKG